MIALKQLSEKAFNYVSEIPKAKWSRAYDGGRQYGHLTTNLRESMNSVLKNMTCLPITGLVEGTMQRCVKYFVERAMAINAQIQSGEEYCKAIVAQINNLDNIASACSVTIFNMRQLLFEVKEPFNRARGLPGRTCRV